MKLYRFLATAAVVLTVGGCSSTLWAQLPPETAVVEAAPVTPSKKIIADNLDLGARRPVGCPHSWCGCWLSLAIFGNNDPELWMARAWLQFPKSSPEPGSIAVLSRGRNRALGHVGVVVSVDPQGNPTIKSGNHNNRVGVATYDKHRVLGYVDPQLIRSYKIDVSDTATHNQHASSSTRAWSTY